VQTDTYTYDNNGNRLNKQAILTGQEGTPQQTTYSYDFENRMISLGYTNIPNITGTQTDSLTYNGEGLRTQAVLNSITANYLYDGSNILVERDGSNNTTKSYTRGLDLGGGIGSLIAQNTTTAPTTAQYYDYNDLGSTADLTTTSGTVTSSYSYDAFGNLLAPQVSGDTNRYLFSSKESDSRSGLEYFGSRYYDSEVGRWLTPDPLGFVDGPNTYLYCLDNPINSVDPYGYWRSPDYYTLTVTVPAPLVTVIGGGITVSIDRNGNIYTGPVAAVGGPTAGGASLTAGYMNQWDTPTSGQLNNLLTQSSFHAGGGFVGGASESWTPGVGTATNLGFFTPGGGAQYSYSWQVNNQNSGGSGNQQFAMPPLSAPDLGGKENAAIGESAFNTSF
jgi:RHS repeat-associated protein